MTNEGASATRSQMESSGMFLKRRFERRLGDAAGVARDYRRGDRGDHLEEVIFAEPVAKTSTLFRSLSSPGLTLVFQYSSSHRLKVWVSGYSRLTRTMSK
jgi:hypothetical protein